jgi:cell division protein FtsB
MEISINTPALLFPAISLIMLAYTNRFLALANVVRNLHDRYRNRPEQDKINIHAQIKNLRMRIRHVRNMQILGVLSILMAITCMFLIYIEKQGAAYFAFAASLILFAVSLLLSLVELSQSTRSLELELSDMNNLDDPGIINYLKEKMKSSEH